MILNSSIVELAKTCSTYKQLAFKSNIPQTVIYAHIKYHGLAKRINELLNVNKQNKYKNR